MKNFIKRFVAVILIMSFGLSFSTCPEPDDGGHGGKEHAVGWMDVSEESEGKFNAMIVGDDGSSMCFSLDQYKIPMELYYKPEKDRDDGYTLLFKENGQLDTMISNGHVFQFDNFDGYTYDWAVIYPDETIEYYYDQQSEVDWDRYVARYARLTGSARAAGSGGSGQARSLLDAELTYSDLEDSMGIVGDAIGIATCVSALVLQVTWVGCALWAIPKIGSLIVDLLPESKDPVVSRLFDILGDATTCVGQKDIFDCVSVLTSLIGMVIDMDLFKKLENEEALTKIIDNGKAKALKGELRISPAGPVEKGTTLTATYIGGFMDKTKSFQWVKDGVWISGAGDEDTYSSSYKADQPGNYFVIAFEDGWFSDVMGNSRTVTVKEGDLRGKLTITAGNQQVDRAPWGTTLTAKYSGSESGNTSFQWRKSGSNIVLSTGASFAPGSGTFIPDNLCNYTVTVKITGYKSMTASVTVTYRELQTTISPPGPVEVGTTLTANYDRREFFSVLIDYTWKGYGLSRGRNDVTVGSNSATFTPEEPGSYRVTFSAINNGYLGKPSEYVVVRAATTVTVPGAPTNLRVTETTSNSITIAWNAVPGATAYKVYRQQTITYDSLLYEGIDATSRIITNLQPDYPYTFKVSAVNSAGEGDKSASVTGTTLASTTVTVPGAPTNLRVTGTTTNSITVEWNAVTGADGYNLYQVTPDGDNLIRTGILTTGANLIDLQSGRSYTVRVSAYNDAGEGTKSSSVTGTTAPRTSDK